tara:strand:+ start:69 stop:482 length:414 start_codon:yes stop_codon:yes gene_type:complete
MENLIDALENDKNESIMNTNLSNIKEIKNNVLQQLNISRESLKALHEKLKNYRFVDEISDLQSGNYVRWINLKNPEKLYLTRGAFLCDIEINNDGVHIIFRNPRGRYCQIRMDEVFLFQRLTDQEQVLLSAIKYLQK